MEGEERSGEEKRKGEGREGRRRRWWWRELRLLKE